MGTSPVRELYDVIGIADSSAHTRRPNQWGSLRQHMCVEPEVRDRKFHPDCFSSVSILGVQKPCFQFFLVVLQDLLFIG
jgi:hypothetical protein